METYKAEGIILQTSDFGESNRVVTIFTKEFGKLDLNAYGCRRVKSPLSGATQIFNHVSIEINSGAKVDSIHEAEILNFYPNLTADLDRLAYTALFFEIVNRMTLPKNIEPKIFNLLKKSLPVLNSRNPKIAALIGSCQFLQLSGFQNVENYPENLRETFNKMLSFDWQTETQLTFKPKLIASAEKIFLNNVCSIIGKDLNALKFIKQISQ